MNTHPMYMPSSQRNAPRPFPWRLALGVALPLLALLLGSLVVLPALRAHEVAAERAQVNQYGVPLLLGPVRPGGPLFGQGALADLGITGNGWDETPRPDGTTAHTVYAGVVNKSGRTWYNVQVVVDLYDHQDAKYATVRGDIGTLAPGQDGTAHLPDMGARLASFQVTGVDGR